MFFFFYQSLEFYWHYYTYPTTTNIAVTTPSHFRIPAVTICNRNMIKRTQLCGQYPHLCAKPNNLKGFCQKHSSMCLGKTSDLEIPLFGYYTNSSKNITKELRDTIQQLTFNASLEKNDMFFYPDTKTWRTTYVNSFEFASYARCYSFNLHIFSKEEPSTVDATGPDRRVIASMIHEKKENLYPWVDYQVFLSVHSPLVPDNPIQYGHELTSGYNYEIFLHFKEEHLLPHPYATNCADYDDLWKKNNKTGPRSQEMCREFCRKTYNAQCYGCGYYQTMHSYKWQNLCPYGTLSCKDEKLWKDLELCEENCKPNCLKLKYTYRFKKTKVTTFSNSNFFTVKDMIGVILYTRDRDVTIVSHLPLYNDWELFSYIGGLMGCWLGISVWAMVGISEKSFRKIIWWKPNLRRKLRRIVRSNASSQTHSP
ncbi:hypothetical protein AVEN_235582-1 [Araneus ventricosus]|uniref:Sodium channel protein Nach n=1 Tax=Araneus ventricosus TaxID=182803 RepID=A0A4Y2BR95_ARAVE|nr:hypothetical protein AVEN_235582-1 [Araneus ventricosus]